MSNAYPYSWADWPGGATGYACEPARKRRYSLSCSRLLRRVLVTRGCKPARPARLTRARAGAWSSGMRASSEAAISRALRILEEAFAPPDDRVQRLIDHVLTDRE